MDLGIFDHLDRQDVPLDEFYESRLRLLERYDAAGFASYHLAEHHMTTLGLAPVPGLFLAAASQRTRKIRLGPCVYCLPLYDPLRLIEEVCMLDQLSRGRFDFGVGRGIVPYEMAYFGLHHLETEEIYREALEVILQGLTADVLDHRGPRYTYRNVPMVLRPFQQPHPPLWYGLGHLAGAEWAATNRVNVITNNTWDASKPLFERYREVWQRKHGKRRRGLGCVFLVCAALAAGLPDDGAAQSRPEGEMRWALYVTLSPVWFDPAEVVGVITPFWVIYALHDALVKPMPGSLMAGSLAESWTVSADQRVYEFKLREGLTFHNGDPFTAEDVKFSFARARAKILHDKVREVAVVGPHRVRFQLHEPWPDFMTFYGTFASGAGWVVPKKYVEHVGNDGFKKHPVGLGP